MFLPRFRQPLFGDVVLARGRFDELAHEEGHFHSRIGPVLHCLNTNGFEFSARDEVHSSGPQA